MRPGIPKEVKDKIADLYLQGKTIKEIEQDCIVSRHTISTILKNRGIKREPDDGLITFNQIREQLPISRGALWRILHSFVEPIKRRGLGGANYYDPDIVPRIKNSDEYKRVISRRIHKKYLRTHPEAYEVDKHIMRCVTCQYLTPEFDPAHRDYQCVNFRGGREIKNLPGRVKCGCWMWEWKEEEENDTKRST